jgi:hypothetical protein
MDSDKAESIANQIIDSLRNCNYENIVKMTIPDLNSDEATLIRQSMIRRGHEIQHYIHRFLDDDNLLCWLNLHFRFRVTLENTATFLYGYVLRKEYPSLLNTYACCSHCHKVLSADLLCGQCHVLAYCDKICQKAHWPDHSAFCKKFAHAKKGNLLYPPTVFHQ